MILNVLIKKECKMRKMFKLYALAAIFAAGLVGCSSEIVDKGVDPIGSEEVVAGIPTYATFHFEVEEAPATRSGATPESAADPTTPTLSTVSSLRLFVFDALSGLCEANKLETAPLVTGSNYISSTVKVTSGNKRVFVIANVPTSHPLDALLNETAIKPKPDPSPTTYAQFSERIYDLAGANGTLLAATPTTVPGDIDAIARLLNPYVMSNAIDASSLKALHADVDSTDSRQGGGTLANPTPSDAKNHITLTIQREIAAVKVNYYDAGTLNATDGKGTIVASSIRYTMENVNRALYLFQRFAGDGDPSTPAPPAPLSAMPRAPFFELNAAANVPNYPNYYYRGYGGNDVAAVAPNERAGYLTVTQTGGNAVFITENTSGDAQYGNTTYAAVDAQFSPAIGQVITNVNSSNPLAYNQLSKLFTAHVYNTGAYTATGTLYQLRGGIGQLGGTNIWDNIFFADEITAYRVAYIINNIPYAVNAETGFNTGSPHTAPTGVPTDAAGISGINPTYGLTYDKEHNNPSNATLVAEYKNGGRSYYRLDIGQIEGGSLIYGVKRNHFYSASITSFKGIGEPTPGDLNYPPGESFSKPTFITATITVAPWRLVPLPTPL